MIKFKTCEVMQYFEYYDVPEISVIESRIKSLTNIKKYAIIIHDKDLLESGEPKKKHFHCVLTFSNAHIFQYLIRLHPLLLLSSLAYISNTSHIQ